MLSDLKILDFTTLLPGPFATMGLADMGAEILKISSPSKFDLVIDSPPFLENGISVNQAWLGRNKKTMALNLKKSESIEIVKKLITKYDILIEQFRPGIMKKLGLGYEELSKINPRLIYCSITGYGSSGKNKNRPGHDINYLSLSGNMSYSGRISQGPTLTNMQISDILASKDAMIGILSAVLYRNKTGIGQFIDVNMFSSVVPLNAMDGARFLGTGVKPKREQELLNGGSIYDFYECKDKKYISIGALEPKFWEMFCQRVNRPDWIKQSDKNALKELVKSKTQDEWNDIFKEVLCCVEPVVDLEYILTTDMVVDVPTKNGSVKQIANSIKFSKTPNKYNFAGKKIGSDTVNILQSLGYTTNEIENLEKKDVFK